MLQRKSYLGRFPNKIGQLTFRLDKGVYRFMQGVGR